MPSHTAERAPSQRDAPMTVEFGVPDLVGESATCQRLHALIERFAPTDRTLLICGETGSGKEVVARRIHAHSQHARAAFIDVNCGAIPENLIEAELFGHAKGAFTGATGYRPGYFQQAGKGTLFLDEIGELPLALQPKLLRILETRSFRPLGATEALPFEGRVITATHRDLLTMVKEGRFREDLYYRLAVFVLEVPTLAQRREDIPALVAHFCACQPRPLTFTAAALQRLSAHNWPGNIRQLRNVIDQIAVLAESPLVDIDALEGFLEPPPPEGDASAALADALLNLEGPDKLARAEALLIDRALARCHGNKSAAAQLLGVGRKTIERRLKARALDGEQAQSLLGAALRLVEAGEFREAIPLLRRALDKLGAKSCQTQTHHLHFEAYRLLGVSLRSVNGWLCGEAQSCYEAALRHGQDCCEPVELATLQFGIWVTQLMTLELGAARATAQHMMQRAQSMTSPAALDEAHVALANTLFWLGDSEETLACLARGGLLNAGAGPERLGLQGFDLVGLALTFEGLAAFQLGAFAQARRAMAGLISRSSEHNPHAFNRAIALQGAAWLACVFEDINAEGELGAALESHAAAHGFSFYQGIGQVFRGSSLGARSTNGDALHIMLDGYQHHMLRHGGKLFHSVQAWLRGQWLLQRGAAEDCVKLLAKAIELALEQQERAYLGELLVLKARAQGALGSIDSAEVELRSALATTEALGAAVPARLAAAYHLALLLQSSARATPAREVLSRALRGLDPAGASPGLLRAQRLFDELREL